LITLIITGAASGFGEAIGKQLWKGLKATVKQLLPKTYYRFRSNESKCIEIKYKTMTLKLFGTIDDETLAKALDMFQELAEEKQKRVSKKRTARLINSEMNSRTWHLATSTLTNGTKGDKHKYCFLYSRNSKNRLRFNLKRLEGNPISKSLLHKPGVLLFDFSS